MLDGLPVKPQLLVERRQAFVDSHIGGYDYQRPAQGRHGFLRTALAEINLGERFLRVRLVGLDFAPLPDDVDGFVKLFRVEVNLRQHLVGVREVRLHPHALVELPDGQILVTESSVDDPHADDAFRARGVQCVRLFEHLQSTGIKLGAVFLLGVLPQVFGVAEQASGVRAVRNALE